MKTIFLLFLAFTALVEARQMPPKMGGESLQIEPPRPFAWVKEILAPWTGWWQSSGVGDGKPPSDQIYIP